MTPFQCTAARNLLKWTRAQLASAAGWAFATIVDFEMNVGTVSTDAIADIRAALEDAGVEFITENGEGPGVRLKKGDRK